MDNLILVKALKEPATKIMKEKNILASFIIACALYYLNSVSESDAAILYNANNVMKRKSNKQYNSDYVLLDGERGFRYRVYESHEDCINDWLLSFRSGQIRAVWDFNTVMKKIVNKELTKVHLKPYVDAYKLSDIDKEVLDELYPSNQSIVEVPPNNTSNASVYQQMSGYTPKITAKAAVTKEAPKPAVKPRQVSYTKGERFTVKHANIFCDPMAKVASRSFNGNVWLYDGLLINGRYGVVVNKENLNKGKDFVDGYIKKSDLL